MKIEFGNVSITLRTPSAFEAVPFVPLFARYLDSINEAIRPLHEMKAKAKTEAEIEKIESDLKVTRERIIVSFFRTVDAFTQKELIKYIAGLITEWSLKEKPTPDKIEKLPPLVLLTIFDAVAWLTLVGDNNFDFFENSLNSPDEKTNTA